MNKLTMAVFETSERSQASVALNKGLVWEINQTSITYQSGLPLVWEDSRPATLNAVPNRLQLAVKRFFDICGASTALLFMGPLLILVASIIKITSNGPILFRQKREGPNGNSFNVLKFRSMRTEDCDVSGISQTVANDPRITPIGRFIRKTSIDELPQLLNVLRGDMSLVGPRPHVAGMMAGGMRYDALVPYYTQRLQMQPGLTGWAQANGLRGPTTDIGSAISRIDHDIAYIQNFSIFLDIKIIVLTVVNEFFTGSGH